MPVYYKCTSNVAGNAREPTRSTSFAGCAFLPITSPNTGMPLACMSTWERVNQSDT